MYTPTAALLVVALLAAAAWGLPLFYIPPWRIGIGRRRGEAEAGLLRGGIYFRSRFEGEVVQYPGYGQALWLDGAEAVLIPAREGRPLRCGVLFRYRLRREGALPLYRELRADWAAVERRLLKPTLRIALRNAVGGDTRRVWEGAEKTAAAVQAEVARQLGVYGIEVRQLMLLGVYAAA
jgi:hypothetical protein